MVAASGGYSPVATLSLVASLVAKQQGSAVVVHGLMWAMPTIFFLNPGNHGKPEAVAPAHLRDFGNCFQERAYRDGERQMHLRTFG